MSAIFFRNAKYELKLVGAGLLAFGIFVSAMLVLGHYNDVLRVQFVSEAVYQHSSNFGITFLALTSYCVARQSYGASRWRVMVICGIALIAVTAYECWGPGNTPDPLDVWSGIVGVIASLLTVFAIRKWGLREK